MTKSRRSQSRTQDDTHHSHEDIQHDLDPVTDIPHRDDKEQETVTSLSNILNSKEEYENVLNAVGQFPVYMLGWMSVVIINPSQLAIIALTAAKFHMEIMSDRQDQTILLRGLAIIFIVLITFINCRVFYLATDIRYIFVLAIVLAYILQFFSSDKTSVPRGFRDTALLLYIILWIKDGWNNVNYVKDDFDDPRHISSIIAVNGTVFETRRYVIHKDGHYVDLASVQHVVKISRSPVAILQSTVATIMIVVGDLDHFLNILLLAMCVFQGSVMLAVLCLRFSKPVHHREYKVPIMFPLIILVISVFINLVVVLSLEIENGIFMFLLIIGGVLYESLVNIKYDVIFMGILNYVH